MKKWMQGSIALLFAAQTWAAPFPLESTEDRNEAVGFAATLWLSIADSLGSHCAALEGDDGLRAKAALASWNDRNGALVTSAFEYLTVMAALTGRAEGADAEAAFHAARKAEFTQAVHASQATWFPERSVDAARCAKLATSVEQGLYDIEHHEASHRQLMGIRTDLERLQGDPRLSDVIPPQG